MFIGKSESHSTSTPGVDSHSSNPPPQVLYQEKTQHQHKKFWIDVTFTERISNVVGPISLTLLKNKYYEGH